ncbi:MAG: Radical SAM superfamily enzyme [Candidatus Methanohalarchaeum thermophilum]|uniref:Radical SAM superfamily enzyme n=1 Tax=Methanohalarchaeum thermophilum TaxID=1903181 RepID=A0A1Q6DUT1_METT1|nr:MAG: Radical SAM superfamily enzyme [Candidatus Methanohalarchaeum thermophilum]
MNLMKKLFEGIWQYKIKDKPIAMSHQVNSECNLRCPFCSDWREKGDQMDKKEIFDLLDEARKFGIILYNAWSTEPLLRDELPEILEYAHKKNMLTSTVTNGKLLDKRIDELDDLDYLTVSVDGISYNKQIRGIKPSELIKSLKKAKNKDISVSLNCVITNKNLEEVLDVVKFAEKNDLLVSLEPVYKHENVSKETWDQFGIKDKKRYKKLIDNLLKLKEKNYPIINSKTYLKNIKEINNLNNCQNQNTILHIDSDGNIIYCRAKKQKLGNYKDGINNIWDKTKGKREEIAKECNGCHFFGYIESSYMDKLKIEPIYNILKNI